MNEKMNSVLVHLGLRSRERLLGFAFILSVATIWVIASFAVQGIESSGVHPLVLTFIANSLFALYLPIYFINLRIRGDKDTADSIPVPSQETGSLFPSGLQRSDQPDSPFAHQPVSPPAVDAEAAQQRSTLVRKTRKELFHAACVVAPLWFLAQLTFNASLHLTSVTSNTILSSASALFTFLFSVALLSEQFTLVKLGCIGALVGGTAMVTLADAGSEEGAHSVFGDLLCLLSSVIYGAYTVAIRKMLGSDEGVAMSLFFGFMGALIFFGVGIPLLVARLGVGVALGTLTWPTFWMVIAKGLLDNVLSDYLWARAILLVGPTLATSGLSMQVPIAIGLEALIGHPTWLHSLGTALLTFIGGAVVLAGFFTLSAWSSGDGQELKMEWERHAASLQAELSGVDVMVGDEEEDGSGNVMGGGGGGMGGRREREGLALVPTTEVGTPATASTRYAVGGSGQAWGGPAQQAMLAPLPPETKFSLD